MLPGEDDSEDGSRRRLLSSSARSLRMPRASRTSQRRSKLSQTFFNFTQVMLGSVRPPTTFVAVQELVGVVAEYCTEKHCIETLQLVSHTWRSAVLDLPKIRQAHRNGISRRNNEIEREAAPVRSYAKMNAFLMLLMFVCVYPWVFLIWAATPTAVSKHNFDGMLACFIIAIVMCGVGATVAFGLTCAWLFQRMPLYTKARWVQLVAHIARFVFLLLSTIAGVVFLTRYQSAWAYNRDPVTQVAECPRAADTPWPMYVTFADPGVHWRVGPRNYMSIRTKTKSGSVSFTFSWWNVSYNGTTYPATCRPEHAGRRIGSLNSSHWKENIAVAINFNVNRTYFDVVAPNTTLQVATDILLLANDAFSGKAASGFYKYSKEWARSRVALTTSLRAPLDEGEFWLMALLWAYILPPSVYMLLCAPELLCWSLWLHKKLRQRTCCSKDYIELSTSVGESATQDSTIA